MRSQWIAMTLLIAACVGVEPSGAREERRQASCLVATIGGDVQGTDNGDSCAFLGVPFAAAPIAGLRWKPPQPMAAWAPTVLPATAPGPSCPTVFTGSPSGSEDCLRLNVWVSDPPPSRPAPVVVWFHTGAFFAASANFAGHNGRRLVEETGVIVVAPNYRHGPFGFLAHPALAGEDSAHLSTGNYGLLDQQAALRWVRDNIAQFGGDPWNVTIAGTSAGGQSVGLQLVSPGSAALFHRAIVQSAFPTLRMATRDEAEAQSQRLAEALGCVDPATILACLRAKSQNQVLTALPQAMDQVAEAPGRVHWRPIVDGLVIPDQPRLLFEQGAFHHVPTIVGANRDEGWGSPITRSFAAGVSAAQYESWAATEFGDGAADVLAMYPAAAYASPMEALARVVGDGQYVCEARRLARSIARAHVPVYEYSYEYVIDELSAGHVIHGVESNILFGNNYVPPQFANHVLTPDDQVLVGQMRLYWTRFAATGNPNQFPPDQVMWPAFHHGDGGRAADKFLTLDATIAEGKRLREAACDFWEPTFLRAMTLDLPASAP
jgi:para-nitrobenzyl esterase